MSQINESRIEAVPGDKLWMRCLLLLAALFIWSGSFAADQVTFIHTDLYGSPVAATNESAEVVWRAQHTPYGEEVLRSDFPRDSVGYTGHLFDNQTDLSYFQARTYDPAVGRFMGVDPVGFDESNIHSFNKYTYANNNPYKYIDPDGRAPTFDDITPFPPSFDDVVNKFAGPVGGGGGIRASSRGSGNNPAAVTKKAPDITKPYKRPSGATTKSQRESVQGKPCVECGATGPKQYADHKDPLVKEYYRTGSIDKTRMRDVDSVQPQCPTCSNKQGAEMSRFSRQQKKDLGL